MVVWFTGTNTGRVYVEGKTYTNGGGTFVANRDGSFTNVRTGRTDVGSSQSSKVLFGEYSGASSSGGRGTYAAERSGSSGSSANGGRGNGLDQLPVGRDVPVVVGPGGPGGSTALRVSAARGGEATSDWFSGALALFNRTGSVGIFGGPTKAQEFNTFALGGWAYPRDPGTDDAQKIEDVLGDSEFLSPAWFALHAMNAANLAYGFNQALKKTDAAESALRLQRMESVKSEWNPLMSGPTLGYTPKTTNGWGQPW